MSKRELSREPLVLGSAWSLPGAALPGQTTLALSSAGYREAPVKTTRIEFIETTAGLARVIIPTNDK